jgi:hypothetical protein
MLFQVLSKHSQVKFILILSIIVVWIGNDLIARDPDFKPTTHIGIQGGMNFSTVSFKPQIKESFLPAPSFGLVFRHVSEPNIGLQIEVNSWAKGWKELIDSVGSYKRNLQTINVPVMASFIAGSKSIRFAFTVGSYVSYLREEKETIEMPEANFRKHYLKPLASKWEFGFTGGVSAEIHTKIGAFAVRASYNHALTNLYPLNRKDYYFSASRQQVIHAEVMYFYSF